MHSLTNLKTRLACVESNVTVIGMILLPLVSFFICVLVSYPVSPSPLFLVLFVTVAINIVRTIKRHRRHNEKLYKLRFRLYKSFTSPVYYGPV